jgi:hypothetical protein
VVNDTPYTVTAGAAQQAHSIYIGGGGQLLIDGGTMAVTNDITGMGKISLHSGILTAKNIRADSLELAGSSKLILGSSSSGSGSAGASESLNFAAQTNQVPEPGTLMLLSTAVLFSLLWLRSAGIQYHVNWNQRDTSDMQLKYELVLANFQCAGHSGKSQMGWAHEDRWPKTNSLTTTSRCFASVMLQQTTARLAADDIIEMESIDRPGSRLGTDGWGFESLRRRT